MKVKGHNGLFTKPSILNTEDWVMPVVFDLKRSFIKMKLDFMKFLRSSKFDGFVKNPLCPLIVIPAL